MSNTVSDLRRYKYFANQAVRAGKTHQIDVAEAINLDVPTTRDVLHMLAMDGDIVLAGVGDDLGWVPTDPFQRAINRVVRNRPSVTTFDIDTIVEDLWGTEGYEDLDEEDLYILVRRSIEYRQRYGIHTLWPCDEEGDAPYSPTDEC